MECLVVLKSGADVQAFLDELAQAGIDYERFRRLERFIRVLGYRPDTFPLGDHPDIESIDDGGRKVHAQQVIALDLSEPGNSPWQLLRIINEARPWATPPDDYEAAFASYLTGANVDIYVCDTGGLEDHPEFAGRLTNIYEYYSSGGAGDNATYHGTACASIAAGETCGPARDSLIFTCKVFDENAAGTNASVLAGLDAAFDHYVSRAALGRPAVCSLTLTSPTSTVFSAAISDMIDAGMVCVAAAGNEGADLASAAVYPAEHTDVIAVAATAMDDTPMYLRQGSATNYGTTIAVSAPGQRVMVAKEGDAYRSWSGTSFATPLVAGVIACYLQEHPRLTSRAQVQAVRSFVIANATTGQIDIDAHDGTLVGQDLFSTLPDRLVYLDPAEVHTPITGLITKCRPKNMASVSGVSIPNKVTPKNSFSASASATPAVTLPQALGVFGQGRIAIST